MTADVRPDKLEHTAVVIPALDPDDRLSEYVRALMDAGFGYAVIVDDGSGSGCRDVFEKVGALPQVTVLHHEKNRGKGAALRTAFDYILKELPDCEAVITADADGQHTVKDCVGLACLMLSSDERALYLGTRDYTKKDIPARSRVGNIATSIVFRILFGQWLKDTQSGLRAFPRSLLPMMLKVEGERYEYEMCMLIACRQNRIPIKTMDIETIYENNNETSHYNPLKDSARIARVMAWNFIKFMGSSLASTLLDWGVSNLFRYVILPGGGMGGDSPESLFGMDMISTAAGRVISATANYILNRKVVFHDRGSVGSSLWKYIVLCVCVAAVSGGCVYLLERIGVPFPVAKIVVDTILYFVNYRVQKSWVFKENELGASD